MKYLKLFFLLITAVSLIVVSCTPKKEMLNTEIATQMFAAFNAHDWQKMNSFSPVVRVLTKHNLVQASRLGFCDFTLLLYFTNKHDELS